MVQENDGSPGVESQKNKNKQKMCAWDIILVKLQIMFKANIYKEDWHEECAERMSGSGQQSFRIAQQNQPANVKKEKRTKGQA